MCCVVFGIFDWDHDSELLCALSFLHSLSLSLLKSASLCTDSVSLTSICCCLFDMYFSLFFLCSSLYSLKWSNVCYLTPCCFFVFFIFVCFSFSSVCRTVQWWQQLNDIIQCFVIIKNRLVLKSEMLIYNNCVVSHFHLFLNAPQLAHT